MAIKDNAKTTLRNWNIFWKVTSWQKNITAKQ